MKENNYTNISNILIKISYNTDKKYEINNNNSNNNNNNDKEQG